MTPTLRIVVFVALALSACTGGSDPPGSGPLASAPPTTYPAGVGLLTHVSEVHGDLANEARDRIPTLAGDAIDGYFQRAFLSTSTDTMDSAFGVFTPGAAEQARAEADVTTNQELGPGMEAIWADRYEVTLTVLARDGAAQGGTAQVAFEAKGVHRVEGNVHLGVYGWLYLTVDGAGAWKIMGYHLNQKSTTDAPEITSTVTSTVTTK